MLSTTETVRTKYFKSQGKHAQILRNFNFLIEFLLSAACDLHAKKKDDLSFLCKKLPGGMDGMLSRVNVSLIVEGIRVTAWKGEYFYSYFLFSSV